MTKIFDRISTWSTFLPAPAIAKDRLVRWAAAADRDPKIVTDLIVLGGVMKMQDFNMVDGSPEPVATSEIQHAYERGRRELALQLLSLAGIGPAELANLLQENFDARN